MDSVKPLLNTLKEIGSIAEHDLDSNELKTLVYNLDYLNRYCNQVWQAKLAREQGLLNKAQQHQASAEKNYNLLSNEAKW